MEKLQINHEHEYLHLALGIPDERAEELGVEIGNLVENAREKGIVEDSEQDGEKGFKLHGNLLFEILVNEIAQTEQERLLLMMRFTDTIERVKENENGGDLPAMLRRFKEMMENN